MLRPPNARGPISDRPLKIPITLPAASSAATSAADPIEGSKTRRAARIGSGVSRLSPGPLSRFAPPTEQLLRCQTVSSCDGRELLAALTALSENLRLLLRRPRPASAGSSKYFQPPHQLQLRFVQKLSVRHVSNSPIQRVRYSPINLRR
jgi:hypothetical protein